MSGVDKPMLEVRGRSLLRRSVDALAAASPVVVVGPERDGFPGVRWTREDPPGGGPVAALAAGLAVAGDAELVAVLAGDLAAVTPSTVERLVAAVEADGAVVVDAGGRRQWLLGVWRTARLRSVLPAGPAGVSLRSVFGALRVAEVPERDGEAADVDTPEDRLRHS